MNALTDGTERIETLIIGGGQAGLAAGYHLAKRGMPFLILDADERIGDHWRERWDSLRLYSPARSDALPGMPFPLPAYDYPTGHQMGDYLASYAERFALPVRSGVRADRLRPADGGKGGYVVTAGGRRYEADQVIVASGAFQRPHVPEFARQLDPSIRQLHSSEYKNPAQMQAGPVLVVGVSHSGADIAYETAATNPTILSGRSHGQVPFRVIDSPRARIVWPVIVFAFSHVMTIRTPIGRKMAKQIRSGGGPLLRVRVPDLDRVGVERHEARTVGVHDGKPMLDDGQVLDVANVVWCTGYRRDYEWIDLPDLVADDGWARQQRGVAPAPGLYFLGIPFTYAFASMLVAGAGRDAKYVVDRIAERVGATARAGAMAPAAAR
jgi:putative flavoprotein involved in K+ transport